MITPDTSVFDYAVLFSKRHGYRLRVLDDVPVGIVVVHQNEVSVNAESAGRTVRDNTEGAALLPPNR